MKGRWLSQLTIIMISSFFNKKKIVFLNDSPMPRLIPHFKTQVTHCFKLSTSPCSFGMQKYPFWLPNLISTFQHEFPTSYTFFQVLLLEFPNIFQCLKMISQLWFLSQFLPGQFCWWLQYTVCTVCTQCTVWPECLMFWGFTAAISHSYCRPGPPSEPPAWQHALECITTVNRQCNAY